MGILYAPTCDYDENYQYPSHFDIFLKINGFWPTDGDRNNLWFRLSDVLYTLWCFTVTGSIACAVYAEFSYLIINIRDVAKAAENMSTTIINLMVLVRCIHMRYALKQIKIILRIFAREIWINRKSHPHIYQRSIKLTMPTFYLSIILWTVLLIYTFIPIVSFITGAQTMASPDKRLPYPMFFPFDYQKYWNYIIVYILSIYVLFVTFSQYYAIDALGTLFISFLCGQFEILHGEILRLVPECHAEWMEMHKKSGGQSVQQLQDMYTRRLEQIAWHHNSLINFSKELDKFSTFPLMFNFGTSTFLICFAGFQFVIGGADSFADFMRFFLYFISVTGQLYLICNQGTQLISRSNETAFHLFMCNWEGGRISHNSPLILQPDIMEAGRLEPKLPLWQEISYYPTNSDFRHKLRFMIMRSHRPAQLQALDYMPLSLETCNRIISSSMSYFALLKTFLDKQK